MTIGEGKLSSATAFIPAIATESLRREMLPRNSSENGFSYQTRTMRGKVLVIVARGSQLPGLVLWSLSGLDQCEFLPDRR
jgi:hypothetical protein